MNLINPITATFDHPPFVFNIILNNKDALVGGLSLVTRLPPK